MRDASEDGRPSLRSGRLEGISLPDLLWAICSARQTGVLELLRDGVRRSVYVQDGRIVFASSGDPDDRLGELLLREELIVLRDLEEALARTAPGKRLGTLLVEAGRLSPESLVRGVLAQVQRIVLDLFTWEWGEYRFAAGRLPTQEVITLGMKTGEIMLQGMRRIRSFTRMRRSVGPSHGCYRLADDWRSTLDGLKLTDDEEQLVQRLERGAASIEQLCNEVFLSNFEIYQTLWALKVIGVAVEVDRPREAGDESTLVGTLERDGIAPVLVRLCRGRETGLLTVIRGEAERTIHLKEGAVVFATSNDIEDGLLAHLMRRGVISLRDRDETAKRLLSNKRVGTILRELGVIDEDDLRTMVREQLAEVLYDTVAWDGGEYRFVAGELPTIEEITLDESLETLIATGLRRVTSWTRVREGCGGLESRLVLAPAYLEVLDSMQVGAEEWEVVSCLKEAHTPLEICEHSALGDFAVCRILWTLRLLGAIEVAEAAAPAESDDGGEPARDDEPETETVAQPDPEPQPIPVTAAGAEEPFEVADIHEMMPAREAEGDDPAIAPSEWAPPVNDDVPLDGMPVRAAGDDGLRVSDEPAGAELLQDTESQTREAESLSARARAMAADGPAEAEREVATDEDEDASVPGPEADDGAEPESEPATPVGDTTCYVPREEVEAALRGERFASGREPFVEPESDAGSGGEGVEAQPADAGVPIVDPDEPVVRGPGDEEDLDGGDDVDGEDPDGSERVEGSDWRPPADLEIQIERFNARQRVLYRTIRAEVGAGAVNFIRSCTQRIAGEADSFSDAELRSDGTWDVDSLKRAAERHQLVDPTSEYQRLLEMEIEMLRIHIGGPRAERLRREIADNDLPGSARA